MSPMFKIEGKKLRQVKTMQFSAEKKLQKLIEDNLLSVLKLTLFLLSSQQAKGMVDVLIP